MPFNGKIDSVDYLDPSRILQVLSLLILTERNVTQMQKQIKWHGGDVNGFALLKNLKMEIAFPVLDYFDRCLRMNKRQLNNEMAKCRNDPILCLMKWQTPLLISRESANFICCMCLVQKNEDIVFKVVNFCF